MSSTATASAAAPAVPQIHRRPAPAAWQGLGRTLWQTLEQIGQRRAARELLELAQRWERIDAALARQLRAAALHDTTSSNKDMP